VRTTGPYVGLDYFVEDDADFFFGRDAERRRIIGNLRASRLTLLYAESGVGKSSLLRAGVSARLRKLASRSIAEGGSARYFPVIVSSWRGDSKVASIAALEAAGRSVLGDDMELSLRRDSLEHAIEDVVAAVDATPLVILDQFEEHFLYEPRDGEGFDDELARCITRHDLRVHFLISVREDAYSLIGDRFKARIPNVYGNYLHLEFLDERAARAAVLEPVDVFNEDLPEGAPRFSVEPELVEAVLEGVRRGRVTIGDDGGREVSPAGPVPVETAYLQLVMKRLWDEEVAAGSRQLRLQTLRQLGGAETIVRSHLDDVLAELPGDQQDSAAAALRFLVTSSGRKIALSSDELREFSDAPAGPLEPALEHLERERILRPIPSSEPDGVSRREIYHDVLAPAILEWRRRHVEERRREDAARELAGARQRARRLETRNRRLAAAVIGLAAVAIALALYLWEPEPVQRLELRTVDARFSLRGTQAPDPGLVLIAVDDKTVAHLNPRGIEPPIPRKSYAQMLDFLRRGRPAVVALDVIFAGPSDRPQDDRALLAAIRRMHDRVVLAFDDFQIVTVNTLPKLQALLGGLSYPASKADVISTAEANGAPTETIEILRQMSRNRVNGPVNLLNSVPGQLRLVRPQLFGPGAVSATGVRTGFAGVPEDVDQRLRRTDYEVNTTADISAQGFAFAAADVAKSGALRADELPTAPRRRLGDQSERTTWIDYRGPAGTVERLSALDVINGHVAPEVFRDKRVVVGVTTSSNTDVLDTPFDRIRGPEVQASGLDTIVRDVSLRDAPLLVDILAIVLLAAVPPAATLTRRGIIAVAVVLGSAILFLVLAQVAFNSGRIVALVVPLFALIVAALASAAVASGRLLRSRRARRSEASLEKQLGD
jgi:CHASE2 domain-containing sensor protein